MKRNGWILLPVLWMSAAVAVISTNALLSVRAEARLVSATQTHRSAEQRLENLIAWGLSQPIEEAELERAGLSIQVAPVQHRFNLAQVARSPKLEAAYWRVARACDIDDPAHLLRWSQHQHGAQFRVPDGQDCFSIGPLDTRWHLGSAAPHVTAAFLGVSPAVAQLLLDEHQRGQLPHRDALAVSLERNGVGADAIRSLPLNDIDFDRRIDLWHIQLRHQGHLSAELHARRTPNDRRRFKSIAQAVYFIPDVMTEAERASR